MNFSDPLHEFRAPKDPYDSLVPGHARVPARSLRVDHGPRRRLAAYALPVPVNRIR